MSKQEIIKTIQNVLKQHPYIVKAEIFGSLARGDFSESSDVDLIMKYDHETRPKGFYYFGLFIELEERLGREVDIIEENVLHDFIKDNIKNSREVIYERA